MDLWAVHYGQTLFQIITTNAFSTILQFPCLFWYCKRVIDPFDKKVKESNFFLFNFKTTTKNVIRTQTHVEKYKYAHNIYSRYLPSMFGDHIKSCCSNNEFMECRCNKLAPVIGLFFSLLWKFSCKWKKTKKAKSLLLLKSLILSQ